MYKNIVNPLNGKLYKINSKFGKKIIKNYLDYQKIYKQAGGNYCKLGNKNCKGNIGLSRVSMPQIESKKDLNNVISILNNKKFKVTEETIDFCRNGISRGPDGFNEILPTQNDISIFGLKKICKKGVKKTDMPIILVSPRINGDGKNYILDGHHRAMSKMICMNDSKAKIIRIRGNLKKGNSEVKKVLKILGKNIPEIFKGYKI